MPSRTTLFALFAALLALFFAPQLGTEAQTASIQIAAPPSFVKDQLFYYDIIRDFQRLKIPIDLDYLIILRNGNKFSATNAQKGDQVECWVNEALRTTGRVHSVTSNARGSELVYRESIGKWQQIFHTISFEGTAGGQGTEFTYEKRWRGSFAMLAAQKLAFGTPIALSERGFEKLREKVEEEFEGEGDRFGSARYQ